MESPEETTPLEPRLEEDMKDIGIRLANRGSPSVDELLSLLDQVEGLLSRVEQSPPQSMLDALSFSMKALIDDGLSHHPDVDVKVAVAACISEITRITAPEAPYDDDKMKEVFQLIVSSFEGLSDHESRSFNKRVSILETVAKVRSCVVMLDLECDDLIVEMFQHFLKAVRDRHAGNVLSSMETIMTLVLEESEEITAEMLAPVLASVKENNKSILPVARKLGENVLVKSADKLKPYLYQIVRSLGSSLDQFSEVVSSICKGSANDTEHDDENASRQQLADESRLAKDSSDEASQVPVNEIKPMTTASQEATKVPEETEMEEAGPEEVNPAVNKSPNSVMSNGLVETLNEGAPVDQVSAKATEDVHETDEPNDLTNVETEISDAIRPAKPEITVKRRGKRSSTILNSPEPSDLSRVDSDKEAEKKPDSQKALDKDVHSSSDKDPSTESGMSEKARGILHSSQKETDDEAAVAVSLPMSSTPHENRPKSRGRPRKYHAPEEASNAESVKPQKGLGKKSPVDKVLEDPTGSSASKNKTGSSDAEAKELKQSHKKRVASDSDSKPLKQSNKKRDAPDSDSKPLKQVVKKKADGSDSESKPLRQSGKKAGASALETKPLRETIEKGSPDVSESKPRRQSGKKGDTSGSVAKASELMDKKGDASDTEEKPTKQSGKKGNAKKTVEDNSLLKKDGKRRGPGKSSTEDLGKASAEDDEVHSPPKSVAPKSIKKPANDGSPSELKSTTSSKRKRSSGKEDVAPEVVKYDHSLVGLKVKVWWPDDQEFYEGAIESFDPVAKKHKVAYADGDVELLNLKSEKWIKVEAENAADGQGLDGSSETHKKKKAKVGSKPSSTQEETDISPERASSSKAKSKSKVGGKATKDAPLKSGGKSENDDSGGKSKNKAQKQTTKASDAVTPKAAVKSDDDNDDDDDDDDDDGKRKATPKTANKSKRGRPSNTNGSGKAKSSLSKGKELEAKGKSADSADKSPEANKGLPGGGSKSSKKRKKMT